MTPALVLAGLSARMMCEQAVRDGYAALALDVFGDVDTRRVATGWAGIGTAAQLRIDASRFLTGLRRFADHDGVLGWVAGSGFEDRPELLDAGAQILPLIGTPSSAVRRVRDPRLFFETLRAHRIAHPEIRFTAPSGDGWLSKDAGSAGGWHIRHAPAGQAQQDGSRIYYQRHAQGTPMSALFIADGRRAAVLGFNELIVRRIGEHPFVYCGAMGPVPLAPGVADALRGAVQSLTAAFGLAGLCSLDFLLDGQRFCVLEINPRPSSSMALYAGLPGDGVMRAHVEACMQRGVAAAPHHVEVRGSEIVFASRALRVGARSSGGLACLPWAHDLPWPGTVFAQGDPVCSVSASAVDRHAVRRQLDARRDAILEHLESLHEHCVATVEH